MNGREKEGVWCLLLSPLRFDVRSSMLNVRINLRLDVRINLRLDVRINLRLDVRINLRLDVRINLRFDVCLPLPLPRLASVTSEYPITKAQ